MVLTGAFAYIQWAKEATFNTDAFCTIAQKDKVAFGFEQKISSLNFTNNKIPLSQLGDVRVKTYAYGQTQGSFSVDFVLASPWFFELIGFNNRSSCGVGDPVTHTWSIDTTADTLIPTSFSMEVGIENSANDMRRRLTGALANSASISASIGETAKVSLDAAFANEATATGCAVLDACKVSESICNHIPYTFAHGSLYWCIGACDTAIAEVQDVSLTIAQNTEHLWGIGDSVAVGNYRRLFELTGTFKASFTCFTELNKVFAQQNDTLCNPACAETLVRAQPTLRLTFWNGTGTDLGGGGITAASGTRAIIIDLTGIAIDSHAINIEPNEPIFEDIPFQATGATITAYNGITDANSPVAT